MRTSDLLQFNFRLLLRQRFRSAMSLLAIDARWVAAYRPMAGGGHAHR